jgi:hypothetical protein
MELSGGFFSESLHRIVLLISGISDIDYGKPSLGPRMDYGKFFLFTLARVLMINGLLQASSIGQ